MAQRKLSSLGYIRMKDGAYSITPAGKQIIGDVK
jgi:Mn-dependent DtxR family transcriptional regulator